MNQIIDGNCNYLYSNSFLQTNQFNGWSCDYPNELNANSFMNGNGPCTTWVDLLNRVTAFGFGELWVKVPRHPRPQYQWISLSAIFFSSYNLETCPFRLHSHPETPAGSAGLPAQQVTLISWTSPPRRGSRDAKARRSPPPLTTS